MDKRKSPILLSSQIFCRFHVPDELWQLRAIKHRWPAFVGGIVEWSCILHCHVGFTWLPLWWMMIAMNQFLDCLVLVWFYVAAFCQNPAGLETCSTEFKIRLVMANQAAFVLFCFSFAGSYVNSWVRSVPSWNWLGQSGKDKWWFLSLLPSEISTRFLIESCLR